MMRERPVRLGPASIAATPGEVPNLDGLRAISIGVVIFGHFALPASLSGVSAVGVLMFFFISGFLITRLLFLEHKRTGRIDLSRFYTRRVIRLYPVLILYLAVMVALTLHRTGMVSIIEVCSALFYFSNYLIAQRELHHAAILLPVGALWSLAVEEHFYIVMPVAAVLFRMRPGPIACVAATVCVGCGLVRVIELLLWPELTGTLVQYRQSETRFDAIAVGVLMAALAEMRMGRAVLLRLATPRLFLIGVTAFCLSYLVRADFLHQTLRPSIQEAALFPIFCGMLFGRLPRLQAALNTALPRLAGRLSYSLYIWQGGAKFLAASLFGAVAWAESTAALLAITLVTSLASHLFVERPALLLRARLSRRDAPQAARPAWPDPGGVLGFNKAD